MWLKSNSLRTSIEQEKWDTVRSILNKPNGQLKAANKRYDTPHHKTEMTSLHLACLHDPPLDVVTKLLTVNPKLASTPTRMGREYPLHLAMVGRRCSRRRREQLKRSGSNNSNGSSSSLRKKQLRGNSNKKSNDVIKYLIDACPDAVMKSSSKYGMFGDAQTPLHLACRFRSPPVVVKMLCDIQPSVGVMTNGDGLTALDIAKSCYESNPRWEKEVLSLLRWNASTVAAASSDSSPGDAGGGGGGDGGGGGIRSSLRGVSFTDMIGKMERRKSFLNLSTSVSDLVDGSSDSSNATKSDTTSSISSTDSFVKSGFHIWLMIVIVLLAARFAVMIFAGSAVGLAIVNAIKISSANSNNEKHLR